MELVSWETSREQSLSPGLVHGGVARGRGAMREAVWCGVKSRALK